MPENTRYTADVEDCIRRAFDEIRVCHSWATEDMIRPECSYAAEIEDGKPVFVKFFTWSDGSVDRSVYADAETFVKEIVSDNEWWVEGCNPIEEVYPLPIPGGVDISGWTLECYEFRKHKLGGISSMIQAGDRYTGGNRVFFLPDAFFEGTFEEFLTRYNDFVPGPFMLEESYVEDVNELKAFLGF